MMHKSNQRVGEGKQCQAHQAPAISTHLALGSSDVGTNRRERPTLPLCRVRETFSKESNQNHVLGMVYRAIHKCTGSKMRVDSGFLNQIYLFDLLHGNELSNFNRLSNFLLY